MALVTVAKTDEVPEGQARRVVVGGRHIAIVNLGEAGFRAIDDVCSHALAFLHEGEVDVDFETIECPRHGSTFDLETGQPRSLPATVPVAVFPVKIENDDVKVEIP